VKPWDQKEKGVRGTREKDGRKAVFDPCGRKTAAIKKGQEPGGPLKGVRRKKKRWEKKAGETILQICRKEKAKRRASLEETRTKLLIYSFGKKVAEGRRKARGKKQGYR